MITVEKLYRAIFANLTKHGLWVENTFSYMVAQIFLESLSFHDAKSQQNFMSSVVAVLPPRL